MNWHVLHRKSSIVIAVLVVTFVAGALTSTASAKFRGPDVKAQNFNVTYVGVTAPVDSMPEGLSDLVLRQADGKFLGKRRSQMTVSMLTNGFIGTKLMMSRPCDEAGDVAGLCIDEGRQAWVVMPQGLLPTVPKDDTRAMFGPAFIRQIVDGEGYDGFATYRITVENPTDTATDGAIITVNIDGYVSKMK